MAGIVYNSGEKAFIESVLSGQTGNLGGAVQLVPTSGSNWGFGLGTRVGGVGSTKADTITQIAELGTTTPSGYGRTSIVRNTATNGWPVPTLSAGSYESTAAQQTFTFTGAPSPNGATMWFLAGDGTIGHDNAIFGADLSGVRTFGNGDQELVTPTYQQT